MDSLPISHQKGVSGREEAGLRPIRHEKSPTLKETAEAFESIFVHHMLQEMRKTTEMGEGILGNSHASKMYRQMFDQYVAEELSQAGGVGLSPLLIQQLQIQIKENNPSTDIKK